MYCQGVLPRCIVIIVLLKCIVSYVLIITIIIMVIFKCYFSGEHIALSIKKQQQRCEHRIRKNQQIKSTVHDAN